MNAMTNIDTAIDEAERLFVDAGKAKAKAESMDMRRKRVRATLFTKYKADGNAAGAGNLRRDTRQSSPLRHVSAGPLDAAGENSLSTPPAGLKGREFSEPQHLAGRERECVRYAAIDPHWRQERRDCNSLDLATETNMPAFSVQHKGNRNHPTLNRARSAKLDRADLRDVHRGPFAVELSDRGVRPLGAEAITKPLPPRRRIIRATTEKVGEGLVQIAERKCQRIGGGGGDPVNFRPQGRNFAPLAHEVEPLAVQSPPLSPVVAALLKSQVVNEPNRSRRCCHRRSLFGRRIKPIAKSAENHVSFLPQINFPSNSNHPNQAD